MKCWVLWQKLKEGLRTKRVYLDGVRAAQDFELLDNAQWVLDEHEVFGVPAGADGQIGLQPAVLLVRPVQTSAIEREEMAARYLANKDLLTGWCRKCSSPAEVVDLNISETGDVSAYVTHHGKSQLVEIAPALHKSIGVQQVSVEAF